MSVPHGSSHCPPNEGSRAGRAAPRRHPRRNASLAFVGLAVLVVTAFPLGTTGNEVTCAAHIDEVTDPGASIYLCAFAYVVDGSSGEVVHYEVEYTPVISGSWTVKVDIWENDENGALIVHDELTGINSLEARGSGCSSIGPPTYGAGTQFWIRFVYEGASLDVGDWGVKVSQGPSSC